MPERQSRNVSVGVATIIAALVTGIFTFVAARQTLRVEVSLPETGKQSFSPEAASKKIEELSRQLDSQDGSEEVLALKRQIRTLEEQLRKVRQGNIEDTPSNLVKEAPGLTVELLPCRLAGDELKCEFRATSTDRDKTVYLRSARVIQGDSSEVWPIRMQFASSVSEGNHEPGSGSQVYAEMVRGVGMRGNVVFAGVDPALASQGLSLIELKFDGLDAQFRGVHPE